MPRRANLLAIPSLSELDRSAGGIGQQLIRKLRSAIKSGELKKGDSLPSTRALAASLGLSRGTIVEVFEQLRAEGLVESRARGGTLVADLRPSAGLPLSLPRAVTRHANSPPLPSHAAQFEATTRTFGLQKSLPFAIATPADIIRPDDKWRRLGNRVRAARVAEPSGYIDPRGVMDLRKAIADHVRKTRAISCEPAQIIITSGIQQGLFLSASVLLSPGDAAWVEDPVYPGIPAVIDHVRSQVVRVPVDDEGLDVARGRQDVRFSIFAFDTPSHQYPSGIVMSLARRVSLITRAREHSSWIVEDDYDCELRYAGHPLPSLQGLDPSRVVYLGSMSKVMFPSLRIGYAIVPLPLVDAFAGARTIMDRHSPAVEQHVLAKFMTEGHFEAHIRSLTLVTAQKRAVLISEIECFLYPWVKIQSCIQGTHLVVWLAEGVDDVSISVEAERQGLAVRAISPLYAENPRSGLMLGFGSLAVDQIHRAVLALRNVLDGAAPIFDAAPSLTMPINPADVEHLIVARE